MLQNLRALEQKSMGSSSGTQRCFPPCSAGHLISSRRSVTEWKAHSSKSRGIDWWNANRVLITGFSLVVHKAPQVSSVFKIVYIHMEGSLFINIISVKLPAKRWNRQIPLWRWKMWFCPHAKTHPHSCVGRICMSAPCVTLMVAQSLLQSIVWLVHNYSYECCGVILGPAAKVTLGDRV